MPIESVLDALGCGFVERQDKLIPVGAAVRTQVHLAIGHGQHGRTGVGLEIPSLVVSAGTVRIAPDWSESVVHKAPSDSRDGDGVGVGAASGGWGFGHFLENPGLGG